MKKETKNTKQSKKSTFRTPHEQKAGARAAKAATPKQAKKQAAPKAAGRDTFGGRLGTRMSKINMVVIEAKAKGATVPEVAEKTGESASIVSAQLGWMVTHKKVATRKEEKLNGKTAFRYFAAGS